MENDEFKREIRKIVADVKDSVSESKPVVQVNQTKTVWPDCNERIDLAVESRLNSLKKDIHSFIYVVIITVVEVQVH